MKTSSCWRFVSKRAVLGLLLALLAGACASSDSGQAEWCDLVAQGGLSAEEFVGVTNPSYDDVASLRELFEPDGVTSPLQRQLRFAQVLTEGSEYMSDEGAAVAERLHSVTAFVASSLEEGEAADDLSEVLLPAGDAAMISEELARLCP